MRDEAGHRTHGNHPVQTRWKYVPAIMIAGALIAAYLSGAHTYLSLEFLADRREALQSAVAGHYWLSACLFVFIYILAVALSFPAASVLTVFGGFLFGWFAGGIMVAIGATTGATLLFLAARSAFGDFLRRRVDGIAKRLSDGFQKNAFNYLLAIRLAPVFPFFAVNIAAALFDISVASYTLATFLGILPGTFVYAYLGQGIDSVLQSAEAAGKSAGISDLVTTEITLAFILLAVLALVPTIFSQTRKAT